MGRSLQMRVVAEGVENKDQALLLRDMGCAEAQGYYFSRPMKAADFSQLMRGERACPPLDEPIRASLPTGIDSSLPMNIDLVIKSA
jgi:predicted signal transduction protein with EAL and GGDEF domain